MYTRRLLAVAPFLATVAPAGAQQLHWDQFGNFSTGTFGDSVDIAGDVNGDGIDDVIVGDLDANPVVFHEGQALVYSGVDGAPLLVIDGQSTLEGLGRDVAGVQDLDGDGRADLVVTALASPPVVYSGATGAILHTFTAQGSGGATSVSAAGDVNADGSPDIVLGHSGFGGATGRVWVASGAFIESGLGPEFLHVFDGFAASDAFGLAVDGAGDVDGDGQDDLLVGAPGESGVIGLLAYNGVVHVFSGADGSALRFLPYFGPPSGYGNDVTGVGDLDGDGFDEVAAGAPLHDKSGGNNE